VTSTAELAALSGIPLPACEQDESRDHDWQEVDWQEGEWQQIQWQTGWTPTQDLEWVASCAEAFAGERKLRVSMLTGPSGIRAIAPLVEHRPLSVDEHIGVEELFEPSDFLYRDPEALRELVEALAAEGRCLRLRRVPADSPTIGALERAYRSVGTVVCIPAPPCPVAYLGGDDETRTWHVSKSLESDLRRAWRRARAIGNVELDTHAPRHPSEVARSFKEALDIEAASWKGEARTALRTDDARRRFFERYCRRAAARGRLRIAFLRIDGHAVAMQITVQSAERLWILKIGYRASHARCSPGMILMHDVIQRAAGEGLASVELLGTAASWTGRFTPHLRETVEVRAFARTARGLAARAVATSLAAPRAVLRLLRRPRS
jgi:CelD/BcsL family acetyltransferase involved in cellulose biosynthesis